MTTTKHIAHWTLIDRLGGFWDVRLDRLDVHGLPSVFRVDFWDELAEPASDSDDSFAETFGDEAAALRAVQSFWNARGCAGEVIPCEP